MDYDIFEKAIVFAVRAHSAQIRKDGSAYILHPMEVAAIAGSITKNPDVLCAAVLHDTVEDTDTTMQDIIDTFGSRIAQLVAYETEDKRPGIKASESWKIRKVESLEVLKNCGDKEAGILWLSDKLSNMRALARDYTVIGEKVFDKFNEKDPKEQRWYHRSVLDILSYLSDTAAYKEYEYLFNFVFSKY